MWQLMQKLLQRLSEWPFSMALATSCSIFSSNIKIVDPFLSSPRRPALPLIWMYYPPVSQRDFSPSNFLMLVKTTVRAGIFSPIEKVSVEKRTLSSPSWKSSSTTSFTRGSSPPWWMPTPFFTISFMACMAGSCLSFSSSTSSDRPQISSILSFSALVVRSYLVQMERAYDSTSFLLKLKTMTGSNCLSMMVLMILERSDPWLRFLFFLSRPISVPSSPSDCMALLKLSSWNLPLSSTARYSPYPPEGQRQCSRGTGLQSVQTTLQGCLRSLVIHMANSPGLPMVAERKTYLTLAGSMMMVSSQTTPRSLSRMQCTSSKITHFTQRTISLPRQIMFRKISVVMTRQVAPLSMPTSPVTRPTSTNSSFNSRYFWLERALIGEVQITLLFRLRDSAMAYSAIAVLPAEVCAQTRTDSSDSMAWTAFCWKGSNLKGYFLASGSPVKGVRSQPAGKQTSWMQPVSSRVVQMVMFSSRLAASSCSLSVCSSGRSRGWSRCWRLEGGVSEAGGQGRCGASKTSKGSSSCIVD